MGFEHCEWEWRSEQEAQTLKVPNTSQATRKVYSVTNCVETTWSVENVSFHQLHLDMDLLCTLHNVP